MDRTVYDSPTKWGSYWEVSTKTPDFHKLVRDGKRLPIKAYEWRREDSRGNETTTKVTGSVRTYRGAIGAYHRMNDVWESGSLSGSGKQARAGESRTTLESMVRNRLLEKVRDADIDLGVAMGEYKQTSAFVSSAMIKTARSYRQLRQGKVSEALQTLTGKKNNDWKHIPGVAANTWLAYSYALSPLLNDVFGACQALEKRRKPFVDVKVVHSSQSRELNAVLKSEYGYHSVKAKTKAKGEIRFRVSNPLLRSLDTVGVLNPLSVAWELVPFSFVVDWFIPIGKYINGILPPQGVEIVDGWVSSKAFGHCYHKQDYSSQPDGYLVWLETREVVKRRTPITSFPRYHMVVPDLNASRQRVASGLALLWSTSNFSRTAKANPVPRARKRVQRLTAEDWSVRE